MSWPSKNEREEFEIRQFIENYKLLPESRHFEKEGHIVKDKDHSHKRRPGQLTSHIQFSMRIRKAKNGSS